MNEVMVGGSARAEFERIFVEHHQKFPDCDCRVCAVYYVRERHRGHDPQRKMVNFP